MIRVQKNMLSPVTFKGGSNGAAAGFVAVKEGCGCFEHVIFERMNQPKVKPDADQTFITEGLLSLKSKAKNAYLSFGILTNNLSDSVSKAVHTIKTAANEKLFGAALKVAPVVRAISKSFC